MRILVIGSGGREHAIIKALKKSDKTEKLYCAPGNGGIAEDAECVEIKITDFDALINFCKSNVDLTVVGSEEPLVLGIVDAFNKAGLRIFGPTARAAEIEGSKSFAKQFMKQYGIKTAEYRVFDKSSYIEAVSYLKSAAFPCVIKADGLAAGKGVVICSDVDEALAALDEMFNHDKFGESGYKVVVEEFLTGREMSVLAFCDGERAVPMVPATDYKRAHDGDEGLNTGGMGAVSPPPFYRDDMCGEYTREIIDRTIKGMKAEGRPFTGVLYFGLIVTNEGMKVIEYNCRFGDPETQVVLPRLETDLVDIIVSCLDKTLDKTDIKWSEKCSMCAVLASGGYPEGYKKGFIIEGLNQIPPGLIVNHAGTTQKYGKYYTNGGRILSVGSTGGTIDECRRAVYSGIGNIHIEGAFYRGDIGL